MGTFAIFRFVSFLHVCSFSVSFSNEQRLTDRETVAVWYTYLDQRLTSPSVPEWPPNHVEAVINSRSNIRSAFGLRRALFCRAESPFLCSITFRRHFYFGSTAGSNCFRRSLETLKWFASLLKPLVASIKMVIADLSLHCVNAISGDDQTSCEYTANVMYNTYSRCLLPLDGNAGYRRWGYNIELLPTGSIVQTGPKEVSSHGKDAL